MSGKEGASSSDSAWGWTSVTAAKHPHVQEQTPGSISDQEHRQTGCDAAVRVGRVCREGSCGQGAVPLMAT